MPFPIPMINPLPIRTDRTLRAVPYVTYTLLFTNLFVYMFNLRLSHYEFSQLVLQWGFIPDKPGVLTLFTHAFIHDGLLHVLPNMLILWLVGTVLEAYIGSITFLLLYFASLISAIIINGLAAHFIPGALSIPMIGSSGAVAGLTGLAAMRFSRLRVWTFPMVPLFGFLLPLPLPFWMPLWIYAVWFAAMNVYMGLLEIDAQQSGGVAHWAHIGGLMLGALAGVLMRVVQEGKRESVLEDSVRASAGAAPQGGPRLEVQRMLRETPDDPEMLEAMAALTLTNGEFERSRDLYARAIPLFLAAGQRERAATCYLNILRIFPEMTLGAREQMTLATALEAMKHFREAVQAFHLMAVHYPELEEAQTALLRTAQIYQRYLGNPAESRRILQYILGTYPDSPWSVLVRERLQTLDKG